MKFLLRVSVDALQIRLLDLRLLCLLKSSQIYSDRITSLISHAFGQLRRARTDHVVGTC